MKTIVKIVPLLIILLCISCNRSTKNNNEICSLIKTENHLSFPLDDRTKSIIFTLFPYTDRNGKEYVTFQNEGRNEILFYETESQELAFKVKPELEGNNGVGSFDGYYIHNLDSIFLTFQGMEEIVIIDKNAQVKDKISYETADDGTKLTYTHSSSFYYNPIVLINNNLYIRSGCHRWLEPNPICAMINLKDKSVHTNRSFVYPTFPGADNKQKRAGIEESISRCFDGKRFVYSFYFDEDIYITPPDHETVEKVNVKSKYINKIKLLDDYGVTPKICCENPNYGNLLYDKFRNIYYRIAYPETEIENDAHARDLLYSGRKKFSIIILDKDFNIIGETLFPEYTYNSSLVFINEDGLYISGTHFMNPDFNEDILSFDCFKLVYN